MPFEVRLRNLCWKSFQQTESPRLALASAGLWIGAPARLLAHTRSKDGRDLISPPGFGTQPACPYSWITMRTWVRLGKQRPERESGSIRYFTSRSAAAWAAGWWWTGESTTV